MSHLSERGLCAVRRSWLRREDFRWELLLLTRAPRFSTLLALSKVVIADDGRAMYFSRAPIPFLRDRVDAGRLAERTLQHIGVYAYSREALMRWVSLPPHPLEEIERLEQLRPLAAGLPIGVAVTNEAPASGIDTEEDLERANARWDAFMKGAVTNAPVVPANRLATSS